MLNFYSCTLFFCLNFFGGSKPYWERNTNFGIDRCKLESLWMLDYSVKFLISFFFPPSPFCCPWLSQGYSHAVFSFFVVHDFNHVSACHICSCTHVAYYFCRGSRAFTYYSSIRWVRSWSNGIVSFRVLLNTLQEFLHRRACSQSSKKYFFLTRPQIL